jgi:hypothetical protein
MALDFIKCMCARSAGSVIVVIAANFDLWGVAEKRRKKKKEKKEKERKKKVFTLKIRFQNYTFF